MSDVALASSLALPAPAADRPLPVRERIADWWHDLADVDWAPDLGRDIGSIAWLRGLATLTGLCSFAIWALPEFGPIEARAATVLTAPEADLYRSQILVPLAFGGDSGERMAATELVSPLASSPERPSIAMTATLGQGDSLRRVLQRAGVASGEALQVTASIADITNLSDIAPGTRIELVLGRRPAKNQPRPLDFLAFRARFDLNVEMVREGGGLRLNRKPILVDDTPLRITGTVGSSLYRSARSAGAPAEAVQKYLQILGSKLNVGRDIAASDEFDLILSYRRAETGEVQVGELLYAGLKRGDSHRAQLLKWESGGRTNWFEASGVGQSRGELVRPTNGAITSGYGMRRHPILRYLRMHAGIDFGGGYGAPIYAVTDGRIAYAGRKGGYGKFVQINHSGGLASGYGHMSRIAVSAGQSVRRGQIIGYIGSTGLSTGPHLHYELYRNGRTINPGSVKFVERAQLQGNELRRFKGELERLRQVKPGAALTPLRTAAKPAAPQREIERLIKPVNG